jgi:cyanate lyase
MESDSIETSDDGDNSSSVTVTNMVKNKKANQDNIPQVSTLISNQMMTSYQAFKCDMRAEIQASPSSVPYLLLNFYQMLQVYHRLLKYLWFPRIQC